MVVSIVSVALAVIVLVSLLTVASGLNTTKPLPDFVAAVNAGDSGAVTDLLVGESEPWLSYGEWLVYSGAELSVSFCTTGSDGLDTCQVRFGDDWFYNRAAPREVARQGALSTVLTVEVIDEQIRVVEWPLPARLAAVEEPFRQWVLRAQPDSAELMWHAGPVRSRIESWLRLDATSGETHMALLDEYLQYLNPSTR